MYGKGIKFMAVKDKVLAFLENNKGLAVSGEELAGNLGVTRNSVWKAIKSLKAEGYVIEGVTNRGYTLIDSKDILSAQSIRKYVKKAQDCQIIIMSTVDSTNNEAKSLAAKGAGEWTVVISEEQTAGKGRLGKSFSSPGKTGIYMSVVLRPVFSAADSLAITTAAAVAVSGAVEDVSKRETQIKWVNDVFIDGLKICGILTEASMSFESGGLEYAVLGIGINVKRPEGGFPPELEGIAGTVYETECGDETRSRIIAGVLDRFYEYYVNLPDKGFLGEYRKRSMLTGKTIEFTAGGEPGSGVVVDIDENAGLVVRLASGELKTFTSGEITLKKKS